MIYDNWKIKKIQSVSTEIDESFPNYWIQQRLAELNISTVEKAKIFIDSDHYIASDPLELPDLEKTALRLMHAIKQKECIGVWGDFDVDGQTSTTLLVQGLRELGAHVVYHIPNRKDESHGIRKPYLEDFLNKFPLNILLTCDTGVSEHEAISFAQKKNIDVLVTDHHSLPDILPDAFSIVNPQRLAADHNMSGLAGVGTAYKLMEFLYSIAGRKNESDNLLDLVALGTIADVAPLSGENRFLVQKGLKALQKTNRLLLQEIYRMNNFNPETLSETHVAFFLAPLLNSLGRLEDANAVVEIFLSNDFQNTKVFASQLVNLNERRKLFTDQIMEAALSFIERNDEMNEHTAIILFHPDWLKGVLGIVANRLVEMYQKPVILLSGDPTSGISGSGRSIEGVNIIKAIQENQDLLTHFGGHAMAAGLSLPYHNLENFKNNFYRSITNQIGDGALPRDLLIDGILSFDQIDIELVKELEVMGPFGAGNPPYAFSTENLQIRKARPFGKGAKHLRITAIDDQNISQEITWWRGNEALIPESPVDIAYHLSGSNYKGKESVQLELISLRSSHQQAIELINKKSSLRIIDYRLKIDTLNTIPNDFPDVIWWREDLTPFEFESSNRQGLYPAKTLVITTSPPDMVTLTKAYLTVNPENIILGNSKVKNDSMNEFLKRISGMVKYIINQKNGLADIETMASAIGQRIVTIDAAIRWLAAKGQISIYEHPDTTMLIKQRGTTNDEVAILYEHHIKFLLNETYNFRKWFLEVSPDRLINEITHYSQLKN